ncbi:MAG: Ig domain-containing protein [Candidatus Weimeria sp.]
MVNLKKLLAVVMAAATAFTFAPAAAVGTQAFAADEAKDTTTVTYTYSGKTSTAKSGDVTNDTLKLDTVQNKTATITVANTGAAVAFAAADKNVVRIYTYGTTGTVTALAKGNTTITASVGSVNYSIPVSVSDKAADTVTATVDGENKDSVSLDLSNSTASNAVKSAKISGTSTLGLTVNYDLYTAKDGTIIAGNKNSIATLASDGTITAGTQTGTVYVKVYTQDNNAKQATGDVKWIKVTVESTPLAVITFSEKELNLDVKNNKTLDLSKYVTVNASDVKPVYTIEAADSTENAGVATISGTTVTAKQVGNATIRVTVPAGKTTRETTATIPLKVVEEITAPAKADSDLALDKELVTLTVGGTDKVTATTAAVASGAAVTFTSDDPTVATVDSNGNVTALKAGTTIVRVNSQATDYMKAGSKSFTVVVKEAPVTAKKVTSVKVTGRKKNSTKVTVSWKKQTGVVIYQVQKRSVTTKKVKGKTKTTYSKWVTKTVTSGSKTSLGITKTKTYQVRVRAVAPDGTKGTWSSAVTSKRPAK